MYIVNKIFKLSVNCHVYIIFAGEICKLCMIMLIHLYIPFNRVISLGAGAYLIWKNYLIFIIIKSSLMQQMKIKRNENEPQV